jgi:signal transduction histidine kinase/ActR/RegA family two-component response regulator
MVPVKRHLLVLVLGALLPLLALAVALTVLLVREDRLRAERNLHENARLLAAALDGELNRSIAAMQTLARSDALRRNNLQRFYEEAKDARDALGLWDNVLLLSPTGEHLFNLMRPFGTPLPPVPQPEGPVTATKTRGPYVSNALQGRVDTDWLMYLNYPVIVADQVKYVLGVTMNYRYWSRWLAERVPQGLDAAIVDRNYVILARTKDAEKLAGQAVQPWFREALAKSWGGTVRGAGVLDPDLVVAFHRSDLSGWHINLFTSGSALDATGKRTAVVLAIGVAIVLGIAIVFALVRAAVLTRGIQGLQEALEGLKGERPSVPKLSSGIKEVTAAISAAGDTAAALRERQDEIEKLHDELRAQNQQLSEADRRKDEFLATLAHELRNPLAPIRTAAEILKHPGLAPEAAAQAREVIERQAQHMTRMVDDLLEVGRMSHGELQLRKETVAIADAVRWALEAAQPLLDQAGVSVAVELPEQPLHAPLYVRADPTRLVQILANLLGNAAKFTPRGGHAWLRAARDGDWIELSVRDDGIGIEPSQIPRLFEMFSQAQPALERARGGLGIGLALVRGLVERHGGTVEAKSAGPGRGAEFIVRLPAAEAPPEAAAAPSRVSVGKRRVLVADDNRDAANSLGSVLRAMGHEVHVVYDGEQALAAAAEFRPDALILDIGMPRANGYDVAARARKSDWGRGATLIALTGWGQQRDKATAAEAGFDHHLTKPVEAAALEALLGLKNAEGKTGVRPPPTRG